MKFIKIDKCTYIPVHKINYVVVEGSTKGSLFFRVYYSTATGEKFVRLWKSDNPEGYQQIKNLLTIDELDYGAK